MQSELVRDVASEPMHQPTGRGPWLRLLTEVLQLAGPGAEFVRHAEREWVSATFCGARHSITLAFHGNAAVTQGETFIVALPDHQFTVPRHLVADAVATAIDHRHMPPSMSVDVELLVLQDS